eukprot:1528773-Rhodomonas_salina.3
MASAYHHTLAQYRAPYIPLRPQMLCEYGAARRLIPLCEYRAPRSRGAGYNTWGRAACSGAFLTSLPWEQHRRCQYRASHSDI